VSFVYIVIGDLHVILNLDFSLGQISETFTIEMQTSASNRYTQGTSTRRGIELMLGLSVLELAQKYMKQTVDVRDVAHR
jgi:hypothetical protein